MTFKEQDRETQRSYLYFSTEEVTINGKVYKRACIRDITTLWVQLASKNRRMNTQEISKVLNKQLITPIRQIIERTR